MTLEAHFELEVGLRTNTAVDVDARHPGQRTAKLAGGGLCAGRVRVVAIHTSDVHRHGNRVFRWIVHIDVRVNPMRTRLEKLRTQVCMCDLAIVTGEAPRLFCPAVQEPDRMLGAVRAVTA